MHLEYSETAIDIGAIDHDAAIESTGSQQGGIEYIRAVGRRDQNNSFVGFESVHLDKQLVQGLLSFVMPTTHPGAAVASDGVDFVDEDDAGGLLLALQEEITDPRGADADEHFDEIGTGDREKRHLRLARNGPGEQRLTGARGSHHQDAPRDAST